MFCPQCGQRQVSNEVRFCSSCGLPLNNVSELLARGGQLPPPVPVAGGALSPRQKGLRQGAMLMMSTFLIVPLVAIIGVAILDLPGEIAGLAAVICFMGGLLRIFYALFLEDNSVAASPSVPEHQYVPPAVLPNYLGTPERGAALPPTQTPHASSYRPPRYDTGELAGRAQPSVTDHTTRLLDKEREEPRDQK
jgi:hypothetical protein